MRRALLGLCVAVAGISAQPPVPGVNDALDAARELRGASLDIGVLTFGNGEVLWERFGHNAIVVSDRATGESLAYNWGMFDFEQPNFLARFLTGDTRYWVAAYPTDALFNSYVAEDRTARFQQLALSNIEKAALAEYVEWNAQEENRYYRYDYYLDNCSTRVRDAIDRVLRGRLNAEFASTPTPSTTWRRETARVTDGDWPPFAGIHFALGRNADRPLSRWNEAFMPERLANHLAALNVLDTTGAMQPLVSRDTVLHRSARAPLPAEPPSRLLPALLLGGVLSACLLLLGAWSLRASPATVGLLRALVAISYLIGGVLGTLLTLAATVTKHASYMGNNLSLLQLHPVLLLLAVCALFARRGSFASRWLSPLAIVVAGVALVGLLLQRTGLPQESGLVVAVTVPVHLALAWLCWRAFSRSVPPRDTQAIAAALQAAA